MDVIELSSKKKKSSSTTSVKKGRKKNDVEETINVEEIIKSVDNLLENENIEEEVIEEEVIEEEVIEEEVIEQDVEEDVEEEEVIEQDDEVKEEPVIKKKRGRKPKSEKKVEEEESVVDENSEVVHKKRGRKPKPKEKVYNIKELSTFETFEEEKSETLILHLPIKSSDIYNNVHPSGFNYEKRPVATYSLDGSVQKSEPQKITENTTYNDILKNNVVEKKDFKVIFEDHSVVENEDKNVVEEYDKKVKEFKEFKLTNFIKLVPNSNSVVKKDQIDEDVSNALYNGTSLKELDEQTTQNVFKPNPFMESSHIDEDIIQEHTNKMNKKNLKNIMVEFINANMYHEWPDQTNIHCWWCCHQFDGPPCCLPEYIRRDKFYVSGCFCSFNCAASYNFSKNDNSVWERYTLLNLMYKKLYNTNFVKISMAPPREVLKMFGGYLSIDEFRDHCIKQDRVFQVVKPPLISIIPKIEENLNPKNRCAVNENILQSTQTKLKLTRSKPLIGEKSTIQTFMNITPKERE
jgi:hypothetical protein